MTKLSRVSHDICLFGSKGSGKSIVEAFYGFRTYLEGRNVYSNMKLNFPYTHLYSLSDIENAYDGLVIFDDLEMWLSSRRWKSVESQQVMQIILQGGKRRLDILFSAKRPENIDILLRDTTDFWVRCSLVPNFVTNDIDDFEFMSNQIENLLVRMEVFNADVDLVNTTYLGYLDFFCSLYDSHEEISKLKT